VVGGKDSGAGSCLLSWESLIGNIDGNKKKEKGKRKEEYQKEEITGNRKMLHEGKDHVR